MSLLKKIGNKKTFHLPSLSVSFKNASPIFNKVLNKTKSNVKQKNLSRNLKYNSYGNFPFINSEIELINNLDFNNDPEENILNSSIKFIKEREIIDNDTEIKEKRIGKNKEEKKSLSKDELKANQSREFFLKYEMMKNEKSMEEEIVNLRKSVEDIKIKKENLIIQITALLKEIYNDEIDIRFLNSDDFFFELAKRRYNNSLRSDDNISLKTRSPKKRGKKNDEEENFFLKTLQLKEKTIRNEKKKKFENDLNEKLSELNILKNSYEVLKDEYKKRKNKLEEKIKFLSNYYHKKLYEGMDIRNEGLVWIIKAIWNLGENIIMSFFPNYLDQYSIDFLFNVAHKSYEISKIKEEVKLLRKELDSQFEDINKHNPNKNIFRTSLNDKFTTNFLPKNRLNHFEKIKNKFNQKYTLKNISKYFKHYKNPYRKVLDNPSIQKISDLATQTSLIEYEILKLKRNELNRLFKEFFENKYAEKYNVNLETVIGALVGENKRDYEMNKYYKMKREYFDNMRYIQYFNLSNERAFQIKENKDNNNHNSKNNANSK